MSRGMDVAIIGGGIIGTALAWELGRRGRKVVVLERDSPGRRATWAAAGMLSPLSEAEGEHDFLELSDESLRRYAGFTHMLREETGIDVEYRTNGKIHVAFDEQEAAALRVMAAGPLAARFDVSALGLEELRQLEPELSPDLAGALLIGRDHRVNNRLLAQALAGAATRVGAVIRTGTPAAAVHGSGGKVTGVRLSSGEIVTAAQVVVAAGSWSGEVDGAPAAIPVFPVKGQMLAVDGRARHNGRTGRAAIDRVVYSSRAYLIPREDGRILVGATVEEVGFRTGPTPRGIGGLIDGASRMVPLLADMPLVETWAGFRPATPDRLPILGEDPQLAGLFYATGHFRNGILLAPVTAQTLADLMLEGTLAPVIAPFGIGRFRTR